MPLCGEPTFILVNGAAQRGLHVARTCQPLRGIAAVRRCRGGSRDLHGAKLIDHAQHDRMGCGEPGLEQAQGLLEALAALRIRGVGGLCQGEQHVRPFHAQRGIITGGRQSGAQGRARLIQVTEFQLEIAEAAVMGHEYLLFNVRAAAFDDSGGALIFMQ
jgi:hypothetical protein